MFRKSFVFILLTMMSGMCVWGQEKAAPAPRAAAEGRAFTFAFGGGGSYLGIETDEVTRENMGKYNLREVRGVAIEKVLDKSPAEAAGLQAGDVIVKFEGEDVTSVRKLMRLLGEVAPDHEARLKIVRNGDEREVTVTVGKRPAPEWKNGAFATTFPDGHFGKLEMPEMPKMPPMPATPAMPATPGTPQWKVEGVAPRAFAWVGSTRQIGVGITSLTKQLGEVFGVPDGKGLLITEVRENSPAARAGLKAGDIIVEIDGKEISPDHSLLRTLHEKKEGDVTLTIVRDRNRQTFTVTPEAGKGQFGELGELTPNFDLKALAEIHLAMPPIPELAPMTIKPMKISPMTMTIQAMPAVPGQLELLVPGKVL
jgi:membrane-associated protease RseP (regulator of RpoE activity)